MKELTDEKGRHWKADDAMYEMFNGKLCPCVMPTEDKLNNPEYQCNPCPRLIRGEKDGIKDKCGVYKRTDI